MRLTKYEIDSIKKAFNDTFGDGDIYLFGSRVDDAKRGGDIDLYIQTKDKDNLLSKKIDFLVKLKENIGDQKVDVVISKDESRSIEKTAKSTGVLL
ncbi:MAG: nucleotidyltransferase domain-containing protein [Campylobacterales bacterium]|nr:nucleotidyltransferase domain-containing protein [Campylobacterales bacterium]